VKRHRGFAARSFTTAAPQAAIGLRFKGQFGEAKGKKNFQVRMRGVVRDPKAGFPDRRDLRVPALAARRIPAIYPRFYDGGSAA
jgi:hypothetical protein